MREVLYAVRNNATFFPDRLAIILPDEQITYGELWQKIANSWTNLLALSLDRDRPVAILIDNPIKHTLIRLALTCAGYPVCPIRPEHASLVTRLQPSVLIHDGVNLEHKTIKTIQLNDSWFSGTSRFTELDSHVSPNRIGSILFTSGSTGIPKPIAKTYRSMEDIFKTWGFGRAPWDRVFIMYGLSANGFHYLMPALVNGSTAVLSTSEHTIDLIRKHKIQELSGSPEGILRLIETMKKSGVSIKLDQVSLGSAPVSIDLQNLIVETFKCKLLHVYNASEAPFIALARGSLLEQRATRGNCYMPVARIEIIDESGAIAGPRQIGRVKIYCDRVSHEWDGRLEIPESDPHSGWFLSNDIGMIDDDGVLILAGRADETINFGGAKYAPEIPEQILKQHPLIDDAGVVAVRFKKSEQQVWLAVVARRGVDFMLLFDWFFRSTSGELRGIRFDQFAIIDRIPRGINGKVLRRQLRERLNEIFKRDDIIL